MAADLDLGPEAANDALVVDQHGGALDAHVLAAIHALLHPDAVFLADLPALVRGEGEGQRMTPLSSISTVVRSMPMYLRPYMLFCTQTPYFSQTSPLSSEARVKGSE